MLESSGCALIVALYREHGKGMDVKKSCSGYNVTLPLADQKLLPTDMLTVLAKEQFGKVAVKRKLLNGLTESVATDEVLERRNYPL